MTEAYLDTPRIDAMGADMSWWQRLIRQMDGSIDHAPHCRVNTQLSPPPSCDCRAKEVNELLDRVSKLETYIAQLQASIIKVNVVLLSDPHA